MKAALQKKMKFSIKKTADFITFTEEILNGKLHFLCSAETALHRCSQEKVSVVIYKAT